LSRTSKHPSCAERDGAELHHHLEQIADAPGRLAAIQIPVLAAAGGASADWARAVSAAVPNGHVQILDGQDHSVAAEAIAPVLREFFA
jgi:uncharacterized protein (UPF0261 family)